VAHQDAQKKSKEKRGFSPLGGHLVDVLLVAVFLFGLAILLYPTISNIRTSQVMRRSVSQYDAKVQTMTSADFDAEWQKVDAYNALVAQVGLSSYFPDDMHQQYEEAINLSGDQQAMMGHIEIPKLSVDLPIYHGTSDDVLTAGVGHIEGSSLPGGGPSTHTVLSGHRGLPTSELFTNLDQMQEGDVFFLHVMNRNLAYEVDQIRIVLPNELEDLQVQPGEDLCTLVTCTPYAINTHRLLVRGHRIEYPEEANVAADAIKVDPLLVASILAVPAFVAAIIALVVRRAQKKASFKGAQST
jgi:sortase A